MFYTLLMEGCSDKLRTMSGIDFNYKRVGSRSKSHSTFPEAVHLVSFGNISDSPQLT